MSEGQSSAAARVATVFATGRGQKAIHTTSPEDHKNAEVQERFRTGRQRAGYTGQHAPNAKGTISGAFLQVLDSEEQPTTLGQAAEAVEEGVRAVVSAQVDWATAKGWGHKFLQAPEAVGKQLTQDWSAALDGSKVALILMVGDYANIPTLQPAIDTESDLLKRALEAKGFQTTLVPQAELQEVSGMRAALAAFASRASSCEVSVIIASGHGMQLLHLPRHEGVRLAAGGFQMRKQMANTLPFREIEMAATASKSNLVLYGACREDAAPYM